MLCFACHSRKTKYTAITASSQTQFEKSQGLKKNITQAYTAKMNKIEEFNNNK